MAAEEGMETPPQDLLLDLPVDVGAVEGGERYRRRLERAARQGRPVTAKPAMTSTLTEEAKAALSPLPPLLRQCPTP